MTIGSRVFSMNFDLQGIRNDDDFVDPSIKQLSILNQVEMYNVFHCDGLLLCVTTDHWRLVVWNSYLGQRRWIKPRNNFSKIQASKNSSRIDRYTLGYDNNNHNHKILRFLVCYDYYKDSCKNLLFWFEIYDFSSSSWKVLDVTPDWDIWSRDQCGGMSLKGNTYFVAQEKITQYGEIAAEVEDFLLCFDFTTERFGPRLSLPFHFYCRFSGTVTLSCVRDKQLAVLYQRYEACVIIEIWITTKIEPNGVLWSKFLKVDATPLNGFPNDFADEFDAGSFFIDEEKKVAVVLDRDGSYQPLTCHYHRAYIIGKDRYLKSVNIQEPPNDGKPDKYECTPYLVLSSYVPSLVQL